MGGRSSRRARRGKVPGGGKVIISATPGSETTSGSKYGMKKVPSKALFTTALQTYTAAHPLFSVPIPDYLYANDFGTAMSTTLAVCPDYAGSDYWTDFLWWGKQRTITNPTSPGQVRDQPTNVSRMPVSGYQLVADVHYNYTHQFYSTGAGNGRHAVFDKAFQTAQNSAAGVGRDAKRYASFDTTCRFEIANQTNFACSVTLYEYEVRHDIQFTRESTNNGLNAQATGCSALEAWATGLKRVSTGEDTTYEKPIYPTTLGSTPFMSDLFTAYFKVTRKLEIELGGGCVHIHTANIHSNKIFNPARLFMSNCAMSGFSRGCLIVATGQPVSAGLNTEYTATGTVVTTSAENPGILDKISTAPVHVFLKTHYEMLVGQTLTTRSKSNAQSGSFGSVSDASDVHVNLAGCSAIKYSTLTSTTGALT